MPEILDEVNILHGLPRRRPEVTTLPTLPPVSDTYDKVRSGVVQIYRTPTLNGISGVSLDGKRC